VNRLRYVARGPAAAVALPLWLLTVACTGQSSSSQSQTVPTISTAPSAAPVTSQSSQPASPSSGPAVVVSPGSQSSAIAGASPSAAPSKPVAAPASSSPGASGRQWNFDTDPVGGLPAGAQQFSGQWAVRAEPDAPSPPNALCQTGQADYPAVALDAGPYTDLTLVMRFKPISGKEDQAGGLIFRVQDKDNYYIARANALEDNVIFFTYVAARRGQLKSGGAKVTNGVWHELRVEVRGTTFVASLDGSRVVDVTDDRYKTGGIGLWTKSDSVTCFDDVQVTSI
jgi:3-keto-disaccharide hydrolase